MKKLISAIIALLILPIAYAQQPAQGPGVTPDSFLYGLDKALDQLTLLLTFDKGEKARKGLEIAQERLLEVKEMVEESKLDAAEKAKEDHGKNLLKVKQSIKELEEDDSLEEIREIIEIEKELEEHDKEVEQTFGELKVKIELEGQVTQRQKDLIDSILSSLQGQTGEVEIEIENKKNKIKIEIERETGKSEEEIEIEIAGIEKEKGIKKQEKAFEAIEDAEEEITELKEEIKGVNVTKEILKLLEQAESKLENAIKAFDEEKFGEAYGQANAAENLAESALRKLEKEEDEEEIENEIEVEIKEVKAKVKIEIDESKWKFELDTVDLEAIINEISARTGLSIEEINAILEVEHEDEEELEEEDETEEEGIEEELEEESESEEEEEKEESDS